MTTVLSSVSPAVNSKTARFIAALELFSIKVMLRAG